MTRLHWVLNVVGLLGCIALTFKLIFEETFWSARAELTAVGATLEVAGIALVAIDFWLPALKGAVDWLMRRLLRPLLDLLEVFGRWLRRISPMRLVMAPFILPFETAMPITPKLTSPQVTTFAEVSERLQAITDRITTIEGYNARQHDELRQEIEERDRQLRADVQGWIARSKDLYLWWRIVGLAVALGGSMVLAVANLV